MSQPRLDLQPQPTLATARVKLREGDRYSLAVDGAPDVVAHRAAGCLLAPAVGDQVLVALGARPFVITVLERCGDSAAEVVVDGDTRVVARGGKLSLESAEGVTVTTKALRIHSGLTEVLSHRIDAVAVRARASFDDLGVLAKAYDVVAERVSLRADRVFRFVKELDQLRARHFDYRADHSAQIRGENTVMVAREVAKIDGEQIHVG